LPVAAVSGGYLLPHLAHGNAMDTQIEKVAVLGAGVMGAQLAAHFANAGLPCLLFDISQEAALKGLAHATTLKPAPLFKPGNARRITPCHYGDHLPRLSEVDWVVEAVAERLEIKHALFERIAPHLAPTAILSSNTSGLPLADLAAVLPAAVQRRFLITHFFNPPRYMHLLELVAGTATDPAVVARIAAFGEERLGKGIVHAKDTPNFIGNRIGVYSLLITLKSAIDLGLRVEEVDRLTGTLVGRAKSATFRTADLVGLDTLLHVIETSFARGENDEERDLFQPPAILTRLVAAGRLGQKSGAGFYRKEADGTIVSLDLATGEYGGPHRVRLDGFRLAKDHTTAGGRIGALAFSDDKAGRFFWRTLSRTLLYAANRIPEISDTLVHVDDALRWGFGWELGPFATWDAIGVSRAIDRMEREGSPVPTWVKEMVASGRESFYTVARGQRYIFDPLAKATPAVARHPLAIDLSLARSAGRVVERHWSASLVDLGDGVLDVAFHSILQGGLNPIDGSMVEMVNRGLDMVEAGRFRALLIGHQQANFCAGANLAMILGLCERRAWSELERAVAELQQTGQRIRFSPAPVVAAPFQLTLGGGFELIAPAAHRVAAAELYCGAVEVGVGLIPGGGGNLRLLLNLMANGGTAATRNPYGVVQSAFQTIGFAKVATSADEAKYLGYLRKDDTVVMNPDHLLGHAKAKAVELAEGYTPPAYRADLILPGSGAASAMQAALRGMRAQGAISDHDLKIGQQLATLLTGGERAGLTRPVDEQYLLDLERAGFLSLAGEPLTQARIAFMLKTGKPLRN